ncbi:hypothetical protein F4780DRAFT_27016 [Xylariomycetidae sp. FL0641]|nr:hypothetical protein F4780DRAFT_27016 [Xylariomycetidae sp. FL0641]
MRATTFITALAIAVYALPIPMPAVNDPLLNNLPDSILSSVSDLLGYPTTPNKDHPYKDILGCDFDSKFCVGNCAAECIAGAQACSNCLQKCYHENSCDDKDDDDHSSNDHDDDEDEDENEDDE